MPLFFFGFLPMHSFRQSMFLSHGWSAISFVLILSYLKHSTFFIRSFAYSEMLLQWLLTSDIEQLFDSSYISSKNWEWNGKFPDNMKYKIMPRLNVSIFSSYSSALYISGAINPGVPANFYLGGSSLSLSLKTPKPKSINLTLRTIFF